MIFISPYADDISQTVDEMGYLIEELLRAQNQTNSKLIQLIHILEILTSGTHRGNIVLDDRILLDYSLYISI